MRDDGEVRSYGGDCCSVVGGPVVASVECGRGSGGLLRWRKEDALVALMEKNSGNSGGGLVMRRKIDFVGVSGGLVVHQRGGYES